MVSWVVYKQHHVILILTIHPHLERDSWLSETFSSLMVGKSVPCFIIRFQCSFRILSQFGMQEYLLALSSSNRLCCLFTSRQQALWSLSGARLYLWDKQKETGLAHNSSPKPGSLCLQPQAFSVCPHSHQSGFCLCCLFIWVLICLLWASLVAQLVKDLPAMWETWVRSLVWEDPLEKEKATHSSIPA